MRTLALLLIINLFVLYYTRQPKELVEVKEKYTHPQENTFVKQITKSIICFTGLYPSRV